MKVLTITLAFLFFSLIGAGRPAHASSSSGNSFLDEAPSLKKFVFTEPEPVFYLGFGVSPLAIMRSKVGFSANIFQLHWLGEWMDWEIFSASFGMTLTESQTQRSRQFTFRTVPKLRVTSFLSVGPMLGVEFISFPDLPSQLYRNGFATPSEPFSSKGLVYGAAVSETFAVGEKYLFKANQVVYRQSYSTSQADNNWSYIYADPALNKDQSLLSPSTVFMLEFSVLY